MAAPVLAVALIPLFANWRYASRAGQTDTREFARDLLNSVEPYGILVTVGDNDTFPLWYAQEVEGIRKDVTVVNTSLLNTDWYVRQLLRRPVFEYDAEAGPAVYRGREWPKPTGPVLNMTIEEADRLPPYVELAEPQLFRKDGIEAVVRPGILAKADVLVLRMIMDAFPERPLYFSRTAGSYGQELGLSQYLITQGLARKLLPSEPVAGGDTVLIPGEGYVDLGRSMALWREAFGGPAAVARRADGWVDRASVGIPYLYIATAATLAEAQQRQGRPEQAETLVAQARQLAAATGLEELFAPPPPTPLPLDTDTDAVPLTP